LEHLLLKCERLKCIFKLLGSWFRKFDENFSEKVNQIYIFKKEKKKCFFFNYLIGTAKFAMWKTQEK